MSRRPLCWLAEDGLGRSCASASPLGLPHSWSGWGPQSPPGTGEARAARPFLGRRTWAARPSALSAFCGDKDPPSRRCRAAPWRLKAAAQTPPPPTSCRIPALPLMSGPGLEWEGPVSGVPGEFRGPTDVQGGLVWGLVDTGMSLGGGDRRANPSGPRVMKAEGSSWGGLLG